MKNLLQLLRGIWNCPKSRPEAYRLLTDRLQPIEVYPSEPATQFLFDDWQGAVFELLRPSCPDLLEDFTRHLLCTIGQKVELAVVTTTSPLTLPTDVAAFPGMTPMPSQAFEPGTEQFNRVKSFLFVRVEQSDNIGPAFRSAHLALHQAGLYRRTLNKNQVLRLLAPWCTPSDVPSEVVAGLSVVSQGQSFVHPLQGSAGPDAQSVHTLSCLHISVPQARDADGIARVGTSLNTLIRGNMVSVTLELEAQTHAFRNAGVNVRRLSNTKPIDTLPALPWLVPLIPMQALLLDKARGQVPHAEVYTQLPMAWGSSALCEHSYGMASLRVRDHVGTPLHLNTWAEYAPGNMLIQGVAGSGNTFLANSIMDAHLHGGGAGWAISRPGNPVFADAHAGQYIKLEHDKPRSLNPLSGHISVLKFEDAEPVMIAWLCMLCGADDLRSQHFIVRALRRAWEFEREGLGLQAVRSALVRLGSETAELVSVLDAKVHGLSPAWFEGPHSLPSNARYLDIGVGALDGKNAEQVLSASVLALHALWVPSRSHLEPKVLVIDDTDVLDTSGIGRLLSLSLRQGRKFHSRIVSTAHGFSADPTNQRHHEATIAENAAVVVLLNLNPTVEDSYLKRLPQQLAHEFQRRGRGSYGMIRLRYLDNFHGYAALGYLPVTEAQRIIRTPNRTQELRYLEARRNGKSVGEVLAELTSSPKS